MNINYTNFPLTHHQLDGEEPFLRLDKALARLFPDIPRRHLQDAIEGGSVLVDGQPCQKCAKKINIGQTLSVDLTAINALSHLIAQRTAQCQPQNIPLNIVYEDNAIIVINKPAGMVTHPGHGNPHNTLQSSLLFHYPESKQLIRSGIVHRLDKNTSGLMVVAKTPPAQKHLIKQFATRTIHREYIALVHGVPAATGVIDKPLGRSRQQPTKMAVRDGKDATTYFQVQKKWHNFALLKCQLKTGRTHQIRVHLEHHGHPIVGDPTYNKHARPHPFSADRQMLQAIRLTLLHPTTNESINWQIDIDNAITTIITQLDSGS